MTDVEMAEEEIICESEQKSQRSPCKWIIVTTIFLIACGLFSALSIYNHLNINRLENDIIQAESRQDSFQIQEVIYVINIVTKVLISASRAARGLKFWLQVALSAPFATRCA